MLRLKKNDKVFALKIITCALLGLMVLGVFSYQSPDISNSIDGSWAYTLATLRHSAQQLGSDVFYTYGPLFSKMPTLPLPEDTMAHYLFGVTAASAITGLVIYTYLRLLHISSCSKHYGKYLVAGLGFAVFLTISPTYVDSLFYLSLLAVLILVRKEVSALRKLLVLVPLAVFSLYKVSFSIAFITLLPFALMPLEYRLKNFATAAGIYITTISTTIISFILLGGGGLLGYIQYMKIGVINAAAYSEFMALTYSVNKVIVLSFTALVILSIVCALLLLVVHYFSKPAPERRRVENIDTAMVLMITYLTVGLNYKQAVVRSDGHLLALIPILPIILIPIVYAVLYFFKPKTKNALTPSILLSLVIALLVLAVVIVKVSPGQTSFTYVRNKSSVGLTALINNPLNYGAFRKIGYETEKDMSLRRDSTIELRNFLHKNNLKNKPVIFFGNTTSLSDTISNKVIHLPFLQNYAAFPPQLFDPMYVNTLEKNTDALIFVDENEPSINERIPMHELNEFSSYLIHNYKVIYKDSQRRQYLLARTSSNREKCSVISSLSIKEGETFRPPARQPGSDEYIKLRVDFDHDLRELALSAFIKPPVYMLSIYPEGGGRDPRRTTKSTLEHGISINPFYIRYTDFANGEKLRLQSLGVSGGFAGGNQKLTYELCGF